VFRRFEVLNERKKKKIKKTEIKEEIDDNKDNK